MHLAAIVLSGFALALAAPWIERALGDAAGLALALMPLGLAIAIAGGLLGMPFGEAREASAAWVAGLGVRASLHADGLSALFALVIAGVGAPVVIYAGAYLRGDPLRGRFMGLLLLFMASMLGLVLAGDLVVLYVFWELTSVSSFLLIGFDHERGEARAGAAQAMLVTEAGGLALLAGLVLLGLAAGTSSVPELLARGDAARASPLYPAILALVLAGAVTKSAQVPFHFWLPAAMEAPAPVSAYLHSATMVNAGVFLLARLHPVIGGTAGFRWAAAAIGAITLLAGAALAIPARDLKRILAYLTVSALGLLTLLLGVGTGAAIGAAMTYFLAHALYKGALFLVAGAVDHATGSRDADRLRGLGMRMPGTAIAAAIAALSMAGLPPLLGFLGKEAALGAALDARGLPAGAAAALAAVIAIAGAAYVAMAARVGIRPFAGGARRARRPVERAREAPAAMWLCPLVLASTGLGLGLAPELAGRALLEPAASAAAGRPVSLDLALWHGLGAPLALSALSVAAGALLYAGRARLLRAAAPLAALAAWGPARGYERAIEALRWIAAAQTRALQSGHLRRYLLVAVAAAVGLVGAGLARGRGVAPPTSALRPEAYAHEVGLAALLALAALAAGRLGARLSTIVGLGAVGFALVLIFAIFGAPDVAMTQVLVETLVVVVVVLVFLHLPPLRRLPAGPARDALLAIAAGALVAALMLAATDTPWPEDIAAYYVEWSAPLAHGHNVVNTILVDFRAIDTLGEITVLAAAGYGARALLSRREG